MPNVQDEPSRARGIGSGDLFGSFFFIPPWTKDAKWGKFFVAVDTDGDCQFFDNITQDFSGSPAALPGFEAAVRESLNSLIGKGATATLNQLNTRS